ncbi:MAG TPA: penicillin-binding protein, partial [Spirochaetia bacterium]|nr:penicillin-binding protein [Spirochaetia bacterium]
SILGDILELDKNDIAQKLQGSGFVWLKRKITPTESDRIKDLKSRGKLKGISLVPEFGRNYPERKYAAHLIGYVGVDNTGLDGIEWSFERELFPVTMGGNIKEIYGNQVFLTLDIRAQFFAEKIAEKAFVDNRADSVMVLAMDARTGELLAYVSLPSFDPNNFREYNADSMVNRPVRNAYEPGSVFKIFSISSFLQLGGITKEDTFYAGGYYENSAYGIRINDLASYGEVNAQKILKYSSNVGAAYASERVNAEDFYGMLIQFGFGKSTGVPLSGETSGILRKPSSWSARTKPTLAFGQEISVSAMQIMAAATVFANDGLILKPLLVKKIVSPEGKLIKEYSREPIAEVLSPDTARDVLAMMETATQEGGTAGRARIEGIRVSAKTGTAQLINPDKGNYYDDRHIASFLGILPTDNPQLIIYVVINYPKVEHYYGSRIAAPVFRELAEKLIGLLGIPRSDSQTVEHSGLIVIPPPATIDLKDVVPDLKGVPKRLLLSLFGREDLNVVFEGEGYVVRQDPAPGTPLKKGMTLFLEFE